MKKVFTIIAASISGLVALFLITTCFIKTNVSIASNNPVYVMVFNQSTTATKENGYTVEDKEYDEVLKNLKKVSSVSIFNRLVNGTKLTTGVEQDLDRSYVKWSTALKQKNIVVELIYDRQQDVIVECDGHTKVVSYYCLSYVIPVTKEFSDVVIYFSTTNGEGKDDSYAACQPLVLKGEAGNFMKFVKSL